MFSHICNPNVWPIRRTKARGGEPDSRRHSWGSDLDFLNALSLQPQQQPPMPSGSGVVNNGNQVEAPAPHSPATSSSDESDSDHPQSNNSKSSSFSGSGSSLESTGALLRATNDLDLVGACRVVDHEMLQRRRRLRKERRTRSTPSSSPVQEVNDASDQAVTKCVDEPVKPEANQATSTRSKVSLTWALKDNVAQSETPDDASEKTTELEFGYDIHDIDVFLSSASHSNPANIPMVVSYQCVLHKSIDTKSDSKSDEMQLQLGMVINAVFKTGEWLYIQTPHEESGYVTYKACMPLGVLPDGNVAPDCQPWDVFSEPLRRPKHTDGPSKSVVMNKTDSQKLYENLGPVGHRSALLPACQKLLHSLNDEKRGKTRRNTAAKVPSSRECRLEKTPGPEVIVSSDYNSKGRNALAVKRGEKVALLNSSLKDWYWVRNQEGNEGFIPSVVAGQGLV